MPDVVVPKAHQNNCSYVSSADLLFGFTMQEFSMVGGYTGNLEKPQNWGMGTYVGVGACLGQYNISTHIHAQIHFNLHRVVSWKKGGGRMRRRGGLCSSQGEVVIIVTVR